tara:strand:+ start:2815 stop:3117 length:303 start_codon:yes stop_codon:yes gene_type:complete
MKKIVVAVLFIGGGYYFIKNILPKFINKSNSLTTDQKEYEVKEFIIPKSGGGALDGVTEEPNKTKSISSIDNDIKRSRGELLNKNNVQSVVNREGGFNMM